MDSTSFSIRSPEVNKIEFLMESLLKHIEPPKDTMLFLLVGNTLQFWVMGNMAMAKVSIDVDSQVAEPGVVFSASLEKLTNILRKTTEKVNGISEVLITEDKITSRSLTGNKIKLSLACYAQADPEQFQETASSMEDIYQKHFVNKKSLKVLFNQSLFDFSGKMNKYMLATAARNNAIQLGYDVFEYADVMSIVSVKSPTPILAEEYKDANMRIRVQKDTMETLKTFKSYLKKLEKDVEVTFSEDADFFMWNDPSGGIDFISAQRPAILEYPTPEEIRDLAPQRDEGYQIQFKSGAFNVANESFVGVFDNKSWRWGPIQMTINPATPEGVQLKFYDYTAEAEHFFPVDGMTTAGEAYSFIYPSDLMREILSFAGSRDMILSVQPIPEYKGEPKALGLRIESVDGMIAAVFAKIGGDLCQRS